jgi:hypothetical protein
MARPNGLMLARLASSDINWECDRATPPRAVVSVVGRELMTCFPRQGWLEEMQSMESWRLAWEGQKSTSACWWSSPHAIGGCFPKKHLTHQYVRRNMPRRIQSSSLSKWLPLWWRIAFHARTPALTDIVVSASEQTNPSECSLSCALKVKVEARAQWKVMTGHQLWPDFAEKIFPPLSQIVTKVGQYYAT